MIRLALVFPPVAAWWDQGHMLVAAVAQRTLELDGASKAVEAVANLLAQWDAEFPNYSTLISAATWADHIKCVHPSVWCDPVGPRLGWYDGLEVFNSFHSIDIPYDISSNQPDIRRYAHQQGRAPDVLKQILLSLIGTENLSDADLTPMKFGSPFSLNLMIRLFIHIFGDIHQPLHVMSLYNDECFEWGDGGGNRIGVRVQGIPGMNLHSLWDSAGLIFNKSYPAFTELDALQSAQHLMKSIPRESVDAKTVAIEHIVAESYGLGNLVYSEVLPNVTAAPCHKEFSPSQHYLSVVQKIAEGQVVLAGYRLAAYLQIIGQKLPGEIRVDRAAPGSTMVKIWAWTATAALVVCVGAVGMKSTRSPKGDFSFTDSTREEMLTGSAAGNSDEMPSSIYCSLEE